MCTAEKGHSITILRLFFEQQKIQYNGFQLNLLTIARLCLNDVRLFSVGENVTEPLDFGQTRKNFGHEFEPRSRLKITGRDFWPGSRKLDPLRKQVEKSELESRDGVVGEVAKVQHRHEDHQLEDRRVFQQRREVLNQVLVARQLARSQAGHLGKLKLLILRFESLLDLSLHPPELFHFLAADFEQLEALVLDPDLVVLRQLRLDGRRRKSRFKILFKFFFIQRIGEAAWKQVNDTTSIRPLTTGPLTTRPRQLAP